MSLAVCDALMRCRPDFTGLGEQAVRSMHLVKDILVFDLILDPDYTAKGLLDLLLAGRCALPAIEADQPPLQGL